MDRRRRFQAPRIPPIRKGIPLKECKDQPLLRVVRDPNVKIEDTRFRIPILSPEMKARFAEKEEDQVKPVGKVEKKTVPTAADGAVGGKDPGMESDSSATSATTVSTPSFDSDSTEDELDEFNERRTAIYIKGPYMAQRLKNQRKEIRQARRKAMKKPADVPLFGKKLELSETGLKYLDEKTGAVEGKKVIRQTPAEYQRNMKAFGEIRKKEWEARKQRREVRQAKFQKEREAEKEKMDDRAKMDALD